jgi:hypothetical protein
MEVFDELDPEMDYAWMEEGCPMGELDERMDVGFSTMDLRTGQPIGGRASLSQHVGQIDHVGAWSAEWQDGPPSDEELTPIIHLSRVREEQLRWLWPGRLPLGKITILDGDPGLGKSLLALDLIARVTMGAPMPDGTLGVRGGAVLLSAEDGLGDTVVPRLRAAGLGGDELERVVAVNFVPTDDYDDTLESYRPLALPHDLTWLAAAISRVGARILVIDPLMAYLDGKVNSWRDQDVRAALTPLARLAQSHGLAVLVLRHLNKSMGSRAIYRGGGSIGLIGAARSGWLAAKDPADPEHSRVLAMNKSNLGPPLPSLRYRIEAADGQPHVAWQGKCDLSADALVSTPIEPRAPSARQAEARDWLTAALAQGPQPSAQLLADATAAGISPQVLREARLGLKLAVRREGFGADARSFWALPEDPTQADAAQA